MKSVCALKIKLKWIQSPFSRPSVYVFSPPSIPLSLHISFLHPFVRPSVRSLVHHSILSLNSPAEEKPFRGFLLFNRRAFIGRQLCWIQHQLPPLVFVISTLLTHMIPEIVTSTFVYYFNILQMQFSVCVCIERYP